MVLMGLFAVWVERDVVVKYLGKGSGFRGLLLAVLLGTLPTGPLYIAFPLAAMLLKKGARVANVMVFLSRLGLHKAPPGDSWNCSSWAGSSPCYAWG